jgi:hypothetical protein
MGLFEVAGEVLVKRLWVGRGGDVVVSAVAADRGALFPDVG